MMEALVVVAVEVVVGHLVVEVVDIREGMHLEEVGALQQVRARGGTRITLVQTKQILLHWVIILIKAKS